VAWGSVSENRLAAHSTKKAAHANYTMSAVEELAKLPGYSDDGLTAVVHDPRGHQFYFDPLPPGSASSSM